MDEEIKQAYQGKLTAFQQAIDQSQRIVFFGGAGVSTASGIPDFRSATGIFMQETNLNYSAEQIISHSFYLKHPQTFYQFYFDNLVHATAKPNEAHYFAADLEKAGKDVAVVTQNIDGLHQEAGSSKVYELHGSIQENYCTVCGKSYSIADLELDQQGIPRCQEDGGIVKPNVILYEEALDQEVVLQAVQAIQAADLLIVAGTSLSVYPAASFLDYFQGDSLVVINQTPISLNRQEGIVFMDTLENVLKAIKI